jgi:hypothetical protein
MSRPQPANMVVGRDVGLLAKELVVFTPAMSASAFAKAVGQ